MVNNFGIKNKFGFGCMRLPMKGADIDIEQTKKMVDEFIAAGNNYFDTAHGYIGGKSELAVKACLTDRYPREKYLLTDKLTGVYFKKQEDIRPFFESQLKACGVDYFDVYLMHAQNKELFSFFKKCRAYETALELKAEGKIKHFGISFHDTADVLEQILSEYPQIEVVQIQYNYLDYEDPAVQSKKLYNVCEKYNKPVFIMEPIKGGSLVNLPQDALAEVRKSSDAPAELALRFAAAPKNVIAVLSGMSAIEQMRDNLRTMSSLRELSQAEWDATVAVRTVLKSKNMIPCTACRYCIDGCPKRISIPDLFACLNAKKHFNDWNADYYYESVYTKHNGKASECIKCGKCEKVCPQKLPIRDLLVSVAKEFEN
ncbi:MAG: aldo/keto reductase [Clostridia bacterium]|nr:aldo/keto reductase [Clostridia bacterium]